MTQPRVVVVLGMHRSGTSLLAQILGRLGVRLGQDVLTEAASDNKYGYWEHHAIARTQDFLLADLGRMWHEPRGVLPMPEGWLEAAATRRAIQTLCAIVRHELASAAASPGDAPFAFKDPRTIRLLPMWERIFALCDVMPRYLLAVRRPQSVVASLGKRNDMAASQARFLWVQHTLEPFRIGVKIAAIVDYDRWFMSPERNMRAILAAAWLPMNMDAALALSNSLLDRDERHHESGGQFSVADRIYDVLTGRDPDFVRRYRLRRFAADFDRATTLLEAWTEIIERCCPAGPAPVEAWEKM